MGPEIRLEWNQLNNNVRGLFSKMKNKFDYHDVTLVCDDNYSVSAHKVVLSIASKFFDNIFQLNKHPHPMICLEGIHSRNLDHILDYIYLGEAKISETDFSQFFKVATRLQLEGINYPVNAGNVSINKSLLNEEENLLNDCLNEVKQKSDEIAKEYSLNSEKIEKTSPQKVESKNVIIDEVSSVKPGTNKNISDELNTSTILNSEEFASIELLDLELNMQIDIRYREGHKFYICKICEYSGKQRHHVKEHLESHYRVTFTCQQCKQKYKSRSSLRSHKFKAHGLK